MWSVWTIFIYSQVFIDPARCYRTVDFLSLGFNWPFRQSNQEKNKYELYIQNYQAHSNTQQGDIRLANNYNLKRRFSAFCAFVLSQTLMVTKWTCFISKWLTMIMYDSLNVLLICRIGHGKRKEWSWRGKEEKWKSPKIWTNFGFNDETIPITSLSVSVRTFP